MNQKSIAAFVIVLVVLILAIFTMSGALSASTSSISYLIRTFGIGLGILAFVRPKLGLYIVTAEAFTTDYLKKVAVYYGNTSTQTITEVMMVVIIALLASYAGRVAEIAFRKGQPSSLAEWGFYLVGMVLTALVFISDYSASGFAEAGQQAFNIGVYVGVGGLMIGVLKDCDELWKFYRFATWFGVAWCLMTLKQSFWGYSALEEHYASTGLSKIATVQFYNSGYEYPRPSGLGSGSANLGAIAVFFPLSLWAALNVSARYWPIVILVVAAAVLSQVKAIPLIVLLTGLAYPFCRSRITLAVSYVSGIIAVGALIFHSDYLLQNIAQIDDSFRGFLGLDDSWSIQTFSDRLYGYNELKRPGNWSWGPAKNVMASHDGVSGLLKSAGGGAVLLGFLSLSLFLKMLHGAALSSVLGKERNLAAMLSGFVVVSIIGGVALGGFLKGQPQGLVIWFSVGGVFLLAQQNRRNAQLPESTETSAIGQPGNRGRLAHPVHPPQYPA